MREGETSQTKSSSILGGFVPVEGEPVGTFTTREQPQDFTTPEFSKFAESSRARWDLLEYLKVKFKQRKEKKASVKIA
ncbi:MAG: hypothetical protein ABH837_02360 [bacterium]